MKRRYYKKSSYRNRSNSVLRGRIRLSYSVLFSSMLFGILGAYLAIVNTVASKGAEIRSLERRIATLQESVTQKKIHEAQLRTLARSDEESTLASVVTKDMRVIVVANDDKQSATSHAVVAIAQ